VNLQQPLNRSHDNIVATVDRALPELYGYLLHRCGSRELAEDLTSEVVLAAIDRVRGGAPIEMTAPYLMVIARNKLIDHWRRQARQRRNLTLLGRQAPREADADATTFEPGRADASLAALNPMQRAALTLRYVDDLSVPTVATALGRSVQATETLLVRAKRAFRDHYSRTAVDHE
jgi:RNA polymerase sigma-70 factor, ECF subfamily